MKDDDCVKIRWASERDARALAAVHVASWREAYRGILPDRLLEEFNGPERERAFRQAIGQGKQETALAEVAGEVVGFATLGRSRDEDTAADTGEIWGIYLAPNHWRKGYGRALAGRVLEELRSRGYSDVVLWVLEANHSARAFYESLGFVPDGATKQAQLGVPRPAVRYRRSIEGLQPES